MPYAKHPADDQRYRRRRAWARAKLAFGVSEVGEALTRLERCTDGCPRLVLVAAIHHFLSLNESGRASALDGYLMSLAQPPAEALPIEEMEGIDDEFWTALEKAGFSPISPR